MDFEVFGQVIAAGKLLFADDALVWFHSRVGAPVSGQLVGPGKPERRRGRSVLVSDTGDDLRHNLTTCILNLTFETMCDFTASSKREN